jgi:hypothetical protein
MPLHSRRAVLISTVTTVAGLAGCTGDSDERSPTATPTANEPADRFTNERADPMTATVRRPAGGSVVRSANRTPDQDRGDYLTTTWPITSQQRLDALSFPDGTENVGSARELLSATDFGSEAVVCQQYLSEDCLTRRVEHVAWGEDAVAIDYRAVEVDGECDVDKGDSETTFVRVGTTLSDGLGYFRASVDQA